MTGKELGGCRIETVLGKGSLGQTFKGVQLSLNRPVAVKILYPAVSEKRQYIERMKRQAEQISSISHPHILQIFDTGRTHGLDYIIMEYTEMPAIRLAVKEHGPFSPEHAVEICAKTVQGLEKVYDCGEIHGDISPDTIYTDSDQEVKISDFGLAKGTAEAAGLSESGIQMGNPAFSSPEMHEKKGADFRSDIYSLGCTFYFMLTGRAPFTGEREQDIIEKHARDTLPPIEACNTDINDCIGRCMEKQPEDRFESYTALLETLRALSAENASVTEQPEAPGMDNRPGSMASDGEHTCPECGASFSGDTDFYNKVTCPECRFSFEPSQHSTSQYFNEGPQADILDSILNEDSSGDDEEPKLGLSPEPDSSSGESLEEKVNRSIILQPREALEIICDLLEQLNGRQHRAGVILPDRIMISAEGEVSITEEDLQAEDLNPEQALFSSPEVLSGGSPDESSDIYSLGILLVYMISGQAPAEADDMDAVRSFHEEDKDFDVSAMNPAVTPEYACIVYMMLGMKGEERISSLNEVLTFARNELKRMDGEEISDAVTEKTAHPEQSGQEEEKEEEETEDQAAEELSARKSTSVEDSRIVCTQCHGWNTADAFVCTTCGKLLRAENPRKQPGTEEEFVEVAEKLIDMGNYDEAYTLSGEGLKKYFSSSSLKKIEALAKQKIEDVRIDGLNKKAEKAASAGRFKEAVNAWEKAGEWSPEIRNGNKKKISQARAALRKKRLVRLAAVLGTLAAAAVILAVLCRKNVYPCLSRICKKAGLRIAFLERYESKGIEEAHPDRHSSAEDLLALLEKGQGKALSEHEKRVLKRARGLLADICRNMIENRVPDKSFFKLLTACQEYAGRTHDEELFRDIREQAVAQCLEQCRKEGLLGKDECLAALKNLRPHADGTGREHEIDSLIEIYETELSREKKHESPEVKAAWAAFNRIIRIENTGDYNKAASEYRKLLSAKSMDTIPAMKERVQSRLHSIKTYQQEANELLEKANELFQTDRKKAASLYAKIKNEYPNSNAVVKVRLPLNLIADPGDADIYVNGKKQDPGSSVIYCSPFSTHILEVRKKGYVPQKAVISEIPYSLSSTWKAEFRLCEAPDQTIHSKEHLRGAGNFGDMIYSAGRNAAVAFYPFKKQTKPEYFAYPEQVADIACASLIWAEVQQGQNPCMLRNSTLVRFDPITEKTSLAGRIEHTPVSPIHLSYFYPGKDEVLCYWDKEGVLRCVALKDISEMWKKKYKDGYAGTGLASYKKHIITTHPDKEQIVFIIKKSGDIEKTFPARGKTHFFTVAHSQVFVCTGNGTIIRINAVRDIKEEWRSAIGLPVSVPVIAGKTHFYVCTEEGTCIAGNTRNGKARWRVKLSDHSLKGGVFLKNKVYIYDSCGIIYAVSPGGTIEKRLYGIDDIASELILFNGKLIFMSKKGSCVVYTL